MGSCIEQYFPLLYIESFVPHPDSRHTRPGANFREGRSLPERGFAPTACSAISDPTGHHTQTFPPHPRISD